MTTYMPPELLHVLGYVTGVVLHAMLLAMVLDERRGDRLTVGAALLGLTWHVGELLRHAAQALHGFAAEPGIAAGSIDIPATVEDMPIPALLVQRLVENPVTHGVAASRSGGAISIRTRLTPGGATHCAVRNTNATLRGRHPGALGGIGLQNLERRLASHYGPAGRFSLASTESGETAAEIGVPAGASDDAGAPAPAGRVRA
jgi:hypothetical protein